MEDADTEGIEFTIEHIIVIIITMVSVIIIIIMVSGIITIIMALGIIIITGLGTIVMFGIFDQEGTDVLVDGLFGLSCFKRAGLQMLHPLSLP